MNAAKSRETLTKSFYCAAGQWREEEKRSIEMAQTANECSGDVQVRTCFSPQVMS